jgi:Protein of unknown function (DUF2568)
LLSTTHRREIRKKERMHMLELLKGANLLLAFLLELCALGAFGYWGFTTGSTTLAKIGLGIGAPLVATHIPHLQAITIGIICSCLQPYLQL